MTWTDCPLVESVPGKHSGTPVIVGTRIPPEAVVENYDAFISEGMTPAEAVIETADCYPGAGINRIRELLAFRDANDLQLQL